MAPEVQRGSHAAEQPSTSHLDDGAMPSWNTMAGPSTVESATSISSADGEGQTPGYQPTFRYAQVRGAAKKRRQRGGRNAAGTSSIHDDEETDTPQAKQHRLEKRLGIISERSKLLATEAFQAGLRDSLAKASIHATPPLDSPKGKSKADFPTLPPARILCLGLGSIKDNRVAQIQLALLLELRLALASHHGTPCPVDAYDPIWSDEDEAILASLDVELVSSDEGGAYLLSEPSLVYMPHCDRALYEALLRKNWTEEGLGRLTLCSNDLSRYSDLDSRLAHTSPCVARAIPHLVSIPLPHLASPNNDAFNDLLLQAIRAPQTQTQPQTRAEAEGRQGIAADGAEDLALVEKLANTHLVPTHERTKEDTVGTDSLLPKRQTRASKRSKALSPPSAQAFSNPHEFWNLPTTVVEHRHRHSGSD